MWSNGNPHSLLVGMQNDTDILEDTVSYKIKDGLVYLAIVLGFYTKVLKTYVHIKILMWIFTAAFFIIAQTWK